MAKNSGNVMCDGTIDTQKIYEAHQKIKEIVLSFKDINKDVYAITKTVNENWVGKGQTEFESQYSLLSRHIEDFGDTLQEIYDGLVQAEADYETADDSLRQEFVMSK